MTGQGRERGGDGGGGLRGENIEQKQHGCVLPGQHPPAIRRLSPLSLPRSRSTATPLPAITKRNRFGEEGGCKLIPALLIDSLEAWIPYFAREKWQLIQPYPLSFCLPAL